PNEQFFRQHAAKYGFNEKDYLEAVCQIPVVPEPYVQPFMNLITEFAHLVASMGLERIRQLETQQALRQNAEHLQLVLEGSTDIFWDWNIDTGKLVLSDRWTEVFGYEQKNYNLDFSTFKDSIHHDDWHPLLKNISDCLNQHTLQFEQELRLLSKAGQWIWVLARGKIMAWDDEQQARQMVGSFLDINQRKQAEEALQKAHKELEIKVLERTWELNEINAALRIEISEREKMAEALRISEEKFSCAFRSSPVLMTITTLPEGRYIDVNDTFLEVTGYARNEVIDQTANELNCWFNLRERRHVNQLLREQGSVHQMEAHLRLKSGELRTSLYSAEIINIGSTPHVLSTIIDITENKQYETALRDSKQQLHDIIDFLPDATLAVDLDGRVIIWNRAMEELTGVQAEDMLHKIEYEYALPFYGYRRPILVDLALKPFKEIDQNVSILYRDNNNIIAEAMVPCLRGKPAYLWGKATPLYDSDGKVVGAIETIRDITDRQQSEEKIREVSEEMQALSHALMQVQEDERRHLARELHDALGQTLTAVKINLQNLTHNNPAAGAQLKESIDIVDQSLQEIRQLSISLRPTVLDDLGLEAALRSHFSGLMQRSGLKIAFFSNLNTRRLLVNLETACFRVVQESLTNVLRHAQAQNVRVELNLENKELKLVIADDGQGFEVELATKNAVQGRSMGLLGMKERVVQAGGRYAIESSPSGGTSINACFPLEG
ncbi:MAG: PAS domain S-box protein, partial [Syntrophomonadaceae bacterium]|nr:PAS domain S-box protein [Syntrophomonadaceae bacterium]